MRQVYVGYDAKDRPPADGFNFCPRCRTELELQEVEGKPRSVCPGCGYVRYRNPAPVVSLLIVKGNQVLLGLRSGNPGKGKWATPSGYIEYEDDFLTTAIREAREETGLEVELQGIAGVTSSFLSPGYHFFGVYVLASVIGGELAAGDDLEAVDWFPLAGPLPDLAFDEDADILAALSHGQLEALPVDTEYGRVRAVGAPWG